MVSIVIPILNEAQNIGKLLLHLQASSTNQNISEIIVVDGGSTDGSQDLIKKFVTSSGFDSSELYREVAEQDIKNSSPKQYTKSKIQLIHSAKGRAKQMNVGASHTSGSILYFFAC